MKLQENDYLYCTARLRAMEGGLVDREKLERMLEARTAADAMAQVGAVETVTPAEREAWFAEQLSAAYAEVLSMLPAPDAVRFMQYPYDCNNIKAALKCAARGIDCGSMLVGCGTLPVDAYPAMVERGDFSSLPAHMAGSAAEAADVYARTGDPQQIDLILDRACFADMLDTAQGEYSRDLVRCKIDLTNLMITVRVLRMGMTAANRAMLASALLPGGRTSPERLLEAAEGGEAALAEALSGTVGGRVLAGFGDQTPTLAALECACDNAWMARVREAKSVPFGEEVPVAYLAAWEYAVKNMRIICAGKDAGLPNDTIRERSRECYA